MTLQITTSNIEQSMRKSGLREHQRQFLAKLHGVKKARYISIEKIKIKVYPNVFPPATDSKLLARNLKNLKHLKVLDITTGSGVFAVVAGLRGARGLAVDINPYAVANAKENIKKSRVNFKATQSDLFSKVPKQKFDFILVNGPFSEGEPKHLLEYAMLGTKKFIANFFKNAKQYLKTSGKILMVYVGWSEKDFLEKNILSHGFRFSIVDSMFSKDKKRQYLLYEIKPK